MPTVPKKVVDRLKKHTSFYKKRLEEAKGEGKNEADTVTIVADMLEDVFGFDKYNEITQEFKIKGTFCDLAIKIGNKIKYLVEVKAIGSDLKELHIRQVVNYCARQGVKWAVLTNGINWIVYRVVVKGKVTHEQVCEFKFLDVNYPRHQANPDMLFMLCRKGVDKDLLDEYYDRQQLLNQFTIAATLMLDETHIEIKKLLRKISPDLKIDKEEIEDVIKGVIRPNLLEDDMFKGAMKKMNKIKRARTTKKKRAVKKISTKPDESSGTTANTGTE